MSYQIGIRRLDVTPPVGSFLAGYAARTDTSEGVYHPLTATVVSLSDGATDTLIVSIEWLGFYDRTEETRVALSQSSGIPSDRIILLGTHTHCGPATRILDARRHGDSALDREYLEDVTGRLKVAAAEAVADQTEVTLWSGADWCGFAASRRKPDNAGGVLWEPSLDAPHDHEVPVVVAKEKAGDVRLVLFSYACHPTSTGPILQIGGDYPGFAITALEAQILGCVALFAKGCGGDQKPGFLDATTGGFRKASIEEVQKNGEALSESVLRATKRRMREINGPVQVRSHVAELFSSELDAEEVHSMAASGVQMEKAWSEHYQAVLAAGEEPARSVRVEVQSLTIGSSLAVVSMAGEMSVEYGIRLKRELAGDFEVVIPLGYANAIVGYIPVDRQLPEGGYEVIANQRAQLRTGAYEPGTEQAIIDAAKSTVGIA